MFKIPKFFSSLLIWISNCQMSAENATFSALNIGIPSNPLLGSKRLLNESLLIWSQTGAGFSRLKINSTGMSPLFLQDLYTALLTCYLFVSMPKKYHPEILSFRMFPILMRSPLSRSHSVREVWPFEEYSGSACLSSSWCIIFQFQNHVLDLK